jgi:DNA-binding NtrC family response regulator
MIRASTPVYILGYLNGLSAPSGVDAMSTFQCAPSRHEAGHTRLPMFSCPWNSRAECSLPKAIHHHQLRRKLNVIPLRLPSLRDRREDIPELLSFFFERSCSRHGRQNLSLAQGLLDRFVAYRWPGNIRELENVVERVVVLTRENEVGIADLPSFLQPDPNPVEILRLDLPPIGIRFDRLEKEVLLRALEQSNWNQSMAARYLGMSRKTLVYRM